MIIQSDISMQKLEELVPDSDDFWQVIRDQDLWQALEWYLEDFYNIQEQGVAPKLGRVKDLIRYDPENVLRGIGADLAGTIWDD